MATNAGFSAKIDLARFEGWTHLNYVVAWLQIIYSPLNGLVHIGHAPPQSFQPEFALRANYFHTRCSG